MTNAVSIAQLGANNSSFTNRIINGGMVIDQRNAGASVTFNDETFPVDRFRGHCTQSSKLTAQRSTTAPTGFINSLLLTSSSAYTVGSGDIFILGQGIEGFNVADLGWGTASTAQRSSTAPTGFSNSLLLTSSSAYSVTSGDIFMLGQGIEGFNVGDLGWGTANAQTITLSFWVRSSLTGTFGGALRNSAGNRAYPFTYTINSANTFEYKTVTIAGDTTGTWLTDNGVGIRLVFSLGAGSTYSGTAGAWAGSNFWSATGATSVVGTNAATFYITGVQLEKGSTATSFDYRPYGTELQLCQRYYEKSYSMASIAGASTNTGKGSFVCATGNTFWRWTQNYRVSKRADSTFTIYSTTGASGNVRLNNASDLAVSTEDAGENATAIYVSRNASVGDFFWWQWTASAEL